MSPKFLLLFYLIKEIISLPLNQEAKNLFKKYKS